MDTAYHTLFPLDNKSLLGTAQGLSGRVHSKSQKDMMNMLTHQIHYYTFLDLTELVEYRHLRINDPSNKDL